MQGEIPGGIRRNGACDDGEAFSNLPRDRPTSRSPDLKRLSRFHAGKNLSDSPPAGSDPARMGRKTRTDNKYTHRRDKSIFVKCSGVWAPPGPLGRKKKERQQADALP